jgi:hypothetical protein
MQDIGGQKAASVQSAIWQWSHFTDNQQKAFKTPRKKILHLTSLFSFTCKLTSVIQKYKQDAPPKRRNKLIIISV